MGGTELLMDFPWRSLETPRQIRQKLSTFGGQATICDYAMCDLVDRKGKAKKVLLHGPKLLRYGWLNMDG